MKRLTLNQRGSGSGVVRLLVDSTLGFVQLQPAVHDLLRC